MRVHKFEGAMFEDEIKYYAHYLGRWKICGQQVLAFFQEVIHGCYAFFVWTVCVYGREQGRDISCDQEGTGFESRDFFNEVEKMFCL